MYLLQHTSRKAKGQIIITNLNGDTEYKETMQCAHCGKHWVLKPGSGRKRGFCMLCNQVTCGQEQCEIRCVPQEVMCD